MQGKPDLPILIVNQELGSQACRRSDDYIPPPCRISRLSHQLLESGNIMVAGQEGGSFIMTKILQSP